MEEKIYQDEPIDYSNYMKDKLKSVGLEEARVGDAELRIAYRRFEIWYQGSLAFWTDASRLDLLKETWERYCTNPPERKNPGFDATLWN